MAKVELNPLLSSVHGKLGNVVLRRTPSGKISLIKLADMSNVDWSEAQKQHRKRFRMANAYAKAAMADENARRHYEILAKRLGRQPYRLAVADYFQGRDLLKEADKGPA